MDEVAAVRVVKNARRRSEKVLNLLRALGDTNENLPLLKRFQRVKKEIERGTCDADRAQTFGELSEAVHALNVLLSEHFYPGR